MKLLARLGVVASVTVIVACTGGGDTSTVGSSSGSSGASGSSGSSGASGSSGSSGASGSSGSSGSSGAVIDGGGSACSLPFETGPCKAAITAYGFNPSSGRCEFFSYGGCDGNANNFPSAATCIEACVPSPGVDPCKSVTCGEGSQCVYDSATPTCARPCETTTTCGGSGTCRCAGSCVNCKDCVQSCLP